jgi:uncharacterized RDD family membrane protein YckC
MGRPALAANVKLAGLRARLLAMVYEAFVLVAVLLPATALFVGVFGDSSRQPLRAALQVYLLCVAGAYLVWSWSGGRRTLAMRTWRIHLVDRDGQALTAGTALVRYVSAVVGIAACASGLLWALFDPQRQFLHDRLAGTRIALD